MKKIGIVGAPMDLGAGKRGVTMGPTAIRIAGITQRLTSLGHDVEDIGDIVIHQCNNPVETNTKLKHLDEVLAMCNRLYESVDQMVTNGYFPLILGGDHSISIGSIAGIAKHKRNLGVIWYDAHADMNTDETTPSGNIHGMPLAANLGYGAKVLTEIGQFAPKIRPERVVIVGARDIDPMERDIIRKSGVTIYSMHEIDRLGIATVMEQAIAKATKGADGLHLSLDLDALDPFYTPGVGTPVIGGLTYRETRLAMEMLFDSGALTSAEFVEVNPALDQNNRTAEIAVSIIATLFGEKLL